MTKDETLRLALKALKETWYHVGTFAPTNEAIELYDKAITALRLAIDVQNMASESTYKEQLETKDEPVPWEQFHEHMAGPNYVAPQRTWVGLTDEEIDKTHETQVWDARRSYARAIEAKLKEKNT